MSFGDIASFIMHALIPAAPYLAAWIVAIILSVIMLRRGGGRAERFLLIGSCLMLVSKLFSVPTGLIVPLLVGSGWSTDRTLPLLSGFSLFLGLIGLAGIICLVYAFWAKFNALDIEPLEPATKEEITEAAPQH